MNLTGAAGPRLSVLRCDITTQRVDAIVNAANESLMGGGGVDGAIHAAAGPSLLLECERLPEVTPGVRCPVGEARLTSAYLLPARHVIHTVGPVWTDDDPGWCDAMLAACYRNCVMLAAARGVRSIAFPCIATGAFGFPAERAAQIAVTTVRQSLRTYVRVEEVLFSCFGRRDLLVYEHLLRTG